MRMKRIILLSTTVVLVLGVLAAGAKIEPSERRFEHPSGSVRRRYCMGRTIHDRAR